MSKEQNNTITSAQIKTYLIDVLGYSYEDLDNLSDEEQFELIDDLENVVGYCSN